MNKNSLFYNYDLAKEKINKVEDFKEYFDKLNQKIKIDILVKWFGICPLFNIMLKEDKGMEYLKQSLINLEYEGRLL